MGWSNRTFGLNNNMQTLLIFGLLRYTGNNVLSSRLTRQIISKTLAVCITPNQMGEESRPVQRPGIWVTLLKNEGQGATPGFFFLFLLIVGKKKCNIFFLCRTYTISSTSKYVYSSRRKHASRKTRYLPNHICYASGVHLERKLTFTAIFLVLLADHFDAFFNAKNTSDTNATSNTPPTSKTYELSRHRCCLTLNLGDNVNHAHSDRCQPLSDCKAQRRKVLHGLAAAEWPQYRHNFTGCKTARRTFSWSTRS